MSEREIRMMTCCFVMAICVGENSMILGFCSTLFSLTVHVICIQDAAIYLILVKCVLVVQSIEQIP